MSSASRDLAADTGIWSRDVVVAINHAPPYRMIISNPDGETEYSGLYIDVIEEAASRVGVRLTFEELPFTRALLAMEQGQADVMLGPNRTNERQKYMRYLDVALPREDKAFYVPKKGAPDIRTYDDLYQLNVGVLRGAVYFDRFDHDSRLRKLVLNTYQSGLRMLKKGRLDTMIMPERLGDYLVESLGLAVEKGELILPGRDSFIAVSRATDLQHLADALNGALKSMVDDGTMLRISGKY